MTSSAGLSDNSQAFLMLGAFIAPPVVAWLGLGAPLDHSSLALVGSSVGGGVIAFIKEKLGSSSAPPAAPPAAPATTSA